MTEDERTALKKESEDYQAAKVRDKNAEKPTLKLTSAQQASILSRANDLIDRKDKNNPICQMCSPIKGTECIPELKSFIDSPSYETCKLWLDKHSKFVISMFVGLLAVALPLVDKKFTITVDKFKEFISCVKDVDGPILPFDSRGHPCLIKLLASAQAKLKLLLFKQEDEYTQNGNIVIKQNQLSGTNVLRATLTPREMTTRQEKKMRTALSFATMENADRQLKSSTVAKKQAQRKVDHLQHKVNVLTDENKDLLDQKKLLSKGIDMILQNQRMQTEQQTRRDTHAEEEAKR